MPHWTSELFEESPELFLGEFERMREVAPEDVESILSLVAETYDHDVESVLDVPCGVGRHAVAFAERGLTAHGVDLAEEYVNLAREAAVDADVADRTRFVVGDMREVGAGGEIADELDDGYDLAVNLWTSLGYHDEADDRRTLAGLRDRLAPGGVLLVELANKEGVLCAFEPVSMSETADGLRTVERREYDPERSRMHSSRWLLDEEAGEIVGTYEIDLRAYAPVELVALLEDAGFREVQCFGSLEGDALERDSTRLVVFGRR